MKEMIKKTHRNQTIEYLLIGIIVLYSGHAMGASDIVYYTYSMFLLAIILAVYCFFSHSNTLKNPNNYSFAILFIWVFATILNLVFHLNSEPYMGYIGKCLIVLLAYELVRILNWESFIKKYINTIFFLCILSLAFFYFLDKFSWFYNLPYLRGFDISGQICNKYQGFLLYYKVDGLRNYGPFWEPGVFASHISIASILLAISNQKKKVIYYIVFFITMITTASSAGYIIYAFTILFVLTFKINKIKSNKNKAAYVSFIFVLFALTIWAYFNMNSILVSLRLNEDLVFRKMLDVNNSTRVEAVQFNWEAFIKSPISGNGYVGLSNLSSQSIFQGLDTATTFRLMAALGVLGITYTIAFIRGIFSQKSMNALAKIILVFIIMLIVNKEPQDAFIISWCLLFYLNSSKELFDIKSTDEREIKIRQEISGVKNLLLKEQRWKARD